VPDTAGDARTVLLSAVDGTGFAFHTAAGNRKVAELAAHPAAAMVALWPEHGRQLVVRGPVVPDDAAAAAADTASRRLRYTRSGGSWTWRHLAG